MCTLNDTTNDAVMLSDPKVNLFNATCFRCKENSASVVVRRKNPFCKLCFLQYATHKFRSCLGKHKIMKPSDRVLVAFSGSQASIALVHMLYTGTQEEQHKKLLYSVECCYIDEGAVLGWSMDERIQVINNIRTLFKSFPFKLHLTVLSKLFDDEVNCLLTADTFAVDPDEEKKLVELFSNANSTSQDDLRLKLRQKLLVDVASRLSCNKIFTAEVENTLAVKVLTSVALGRGDQILNEMGFADSRFKEIVILRPLRDLDRKSIAFYNKFYDLKAIFIRPRLQCAIRQLTENFIVGLKEEFPSTVSTVVRTGEKMCSSNSEINEDEICLLCRGGTTRQPDLAYSSAQATAYSKLISLANENFAENDMSNYFCYGCLLIVRKLESVNLLPVTLLSEIAQRRERTSLREQIAEFLL